MIPVWSKCTPEQFLVHVQQALDFAWLEHAPHYDGNPKAGLIAQIGKVEYGPEESPSLIGFYRGKYLVMFKPGESTMCACVWLVAGGILSVEQV